MQPSIAQQKIIRVTGSGRREEIDTLAAEEPLEIRLRYGPSHQRLTQNISVTMRTPGQDEELALGFLFTEGIIAWPEAVQSVQHSDNNVLVHLNEGIQVELARMERNFYTTSSCGVCGKASIDALRTARPPQEQPTVRIAAGLLPHLPHRLRAAQDLFKHTGGLHGCALFDLQGRLLLAREDVGRHNALDKLIGAALRQSEYVPNDCLLLLSGRASFELIQKAWMAGIQIVAAVGAPSSLAVQTAAEADMTLAGFLRDGGFNIYCGEKRIIFTYEDQD